MNNLLPPKYLFKYKPLKGKRDLNRLEDIIVNNRLFFPKYTCLNDPVEGQIIGFNSLGYAGSSFYPLSDTEDPFVVREKNKYRILSLSDTAVSSLLWTHYACGYSGVCLCYSTRKSFSNVKPVIYRNATEKYSSEEFDYDDGLFKEIVYSSYFYKQEDWQYEHEWRIVCKSKGRYFQYDGDELVGIIVGNRVSDVFVEKIKTFVAESGNNKIELLRATPGYKTLRINVFPIDYKYEYDGTELRRIESLAEFFDSKTRMNADNRDYFQN